MTTDRSIELGQIRFFLPQERDDRLPPARVGLGFEQFSVVADVELVDFAR